jgi:enoyl-CoA hydratase/carnithine racemase
MTSPADNPLTIDTDGPIQAWTINLPHIGNAITDTGFISALESAVDDANADTAVRAVILTGQGKIFSAGGNVKEMADRQGMFGVAPLEQRRGYLDGIQRIPRALARFEVPLIAAVNGPAVGAAATWR